MRHRRPAQALLVADELTKSYGSGTAACLALRGVDLAVHAGEHLAVVGRSGSGKSTLVQLMALLDRPTSGRVVVDGVDTSAMSPRSLARLRNRTFGFVFQTFHLAPYLSVVDNVALPLAIRGVTRRTRRERALAELDALGVGDLADRRPGELSGGQRQRVCVARALVGDPQVLVADEPTGNLDSESGALVEQALLERSRERGATLVLVTHDELLAARCDRQVVVADGRLAATHQLAPVRPVPALHLAGSPA